MCQRFQRARLAPDDFAVDVRLSHLLRTIWDEILARYGRRTGRFETIIHHLGLALGGRLASAFADRLMMPVSNDTLLRTIRRRSAERREELSVIGIDEDRGTAQSSAISNGASQ